MRTIEEYMKLPYRIELIPDADEGGFVVTFPDLPGCLSSGETVEEACKNAKYVIVTDYNLNGEDGDQIINDVCKDAKYDNFEVIRDRYKAIEKGISLLESNDVLLILGHGQERLLDIGNKKIEFDDRKVAKKIIDSLKTTI